LDTKLTTLSTQSNCVAVIVTETFVVIAVAVPHSSNLLPPHMLMQPVLDTKFVSVPQKQPVPLNVKLCEKKLAPQNVEQSWFVMLTD